MLLQLSNFCNDLNIICSEEWVEFKTKGTSDEMSVINDINSYSVVRS